MREPKIGDRVYAHYRQHSIPTSSLGTITEIELEGQRVTVQLDRPDLETGGLVNVARGAITWETP